MKTSELTGAALDWAVAKCEGFELNFEQDEKDFWINRTKDWQQYYPPFGYLKKVFFPSSDWSQGGEIIERERLCISTGSAESVYMSWIYDGLEMTWITHAETPLIAAMRCYVASKLGDEVDIPQQLTQQ